MAERRTVVVSGVPAVFPAGRMVDKLTVHFQTRRRSHGGDVAAVAYPTNMDGVAFVTFDEAADAERVVRKEQQLMEDGEFPEVYLLTVFPFSRDVFLYVSSATVDLSVFGRDQATLIQSLRSAHRSLRFQPLLQQRKATVEGPFTAVQALRQDLIRRAGASAQTAAVKPKETPLNPRLISPYESAGSVSRSRSTAQLEPASLNSLSAPLQSTGEAAAVQTLLSNTKAPKASTRQKVSHRTPAAGRLSITGSDEEERRVQSRPTERAYVREVVGEEISAGMRSSSSGLDLLPAVDGAPREDISQKDTRPDGVSAAERRRQNHSGRSSWSSMKESDLSSAVAAPPLLTASSESQTKDAERLSALCPKHPADTCVWVDSYTFRYIKKFDSWQLDKCLRGLDVSVESVEGTELMQVMLTEKRSSASASRIQQAMENLSALVEKWQLTLRVYEVFCNEEQPEKQKLRQICDGVNFLFDDVLYTLEDSGVKVIGPSASSLLFYRRVEDRIAKLKDKSLPVYWS